MAMVFDVKCTVLVQKGKKQIEEVIAAQVKARNGKGAIRIFLLESTALDEKGGNVRKIEATEREDLVKNGFLGETVETPKAKKAPKAKPAATAPAAEATPAE
jgi:hypothetical protein